MSATGEQVSVTGCTWGGSEDKDENVTAKVYMRHSTRASAGPGIMGPNTVSEQTGVSPSGSKV